MEKYTVGYARVSTPTQRLDRQIRNLKDAYPDIVIVAEVFSGKTENRPKWQKLLRQCRAGNINKLVFDEVSRFSRNAEEAVKEYKELYGLGIELEFLKEPHINSSIYRQSSERKIDIDTAKMDEETANLINTVVGGLNDYLMAVAEKQIFLAFEHAQKEREFLSQRTSEGLKQAKLMGRKVGRQKGEKIETRKAKKAKRYIRANYKPLGGCLTATECMRAAQITKSTFYRYLQQMRDEEGLEWDDENDEHSTELTVTEIHKKVEEYHKNKD